MTGAPSSLAAPAARRRASPYRLVGERVPEHKSQRGICSVLRLELAREGHVSPHGVVWFCVDHANFGGKVPGTRQARGIIAGLPDLWVLHLGRAFGIELKAADGEMSEPQREFAHAMLRTDSRYSVARDERDVLRILDEWQIPRANRVRL
jgi:hypothetical protein